MKIETTPTREGVCANCGGRGCAQCRPTATTNECLHCGGVGCAQCRKELQNGDARDEWVEMVNIVAQTKADDAAAPVHLLSLSWIECPQRGSLLMLDIMPDDDEPDEEWQAGAMAVATKFWLHLQEAPEVPDHFTAVVTDGITGPHLTITTTIPEKLDRISFLEFAKWAVPVVRWVQMGEDAAN